MDAHPLRSLSWKERTFRIFLGIARSLRLCICQKQRLTNLLPLYRKIRKGRLKAAKNQGEKMSGIHTADRPMNFRKIDPPAKQIPRIPLSSKRDIKAEPKLPDKAAFMQKAIRIPQFCSRALFRDRKTGQTASRIFRLEV